MPLDDGRARVDRPATFAPDDLGATARARAGIDCGGRARPERRPRRRHRSDVRARPRARARHDLPAVVAWIVWRPSTTRPRAADRLAELGRAAPSCADVRHLIHDEADPHWILRAPMVLESVAAARGSTAWILELPAVFPRHLGDVPELARSIPRPDDRDRPPRQAAARERRSCQSGPQRSKRSRRAIRNVSGQAVGPQHGATADPPAGQPHDLREAAVEVALASVRHRPPALRQRLARRPSSTGITGASGARRGAFVGELAPRDAPRWPPAGGGDRAPHLPARRQ